MTEPSQTATRPVMRIGAETGGLFGSAQYLAAAAKHDGADSGAVVMGAVRLPALCLPDGLVYTPYGYPQPTGDLSAGALAEAASALVSANFPWRVALAPIGAGASFAGALERHITPSGGRAICVHDLEPERDPVDAFAANARGMVRRARELGVTVDQGEPTAEFGALYRLQMDVHRADRAYYFDDEYIVSLAHAGGTQLIARDGHGPAAGALFMSAGGEATYHLSWRRREPSPPPGAVNLLVAVGLRFCRDAGARVCYLGGGRGESDDDALLAFKMPMATRTVQRPRFESAEAR